MLAFVVFLNREIDRKYDLAENKLNQWQEDYFHQQELIYLNSSALSIAEDKQNLETHFSNSTNVVPFLDYLENLAKKAGIKAELSLVDIPQKEEGLIVEMETAGDFNTLYKFFKLLENSPYQLEFISFTLNNVAVDEETLEKKEFKFRWEASLKIKLLSFIK